MFKTKTDLPAPGFPVLKTENLVLRQILPDDQMQVYLALSNRQVIKYYGVEYHSYDATGEQMQWYRDLFETKTGLWWAITQHQQNLLIGACGIYNWQVLHRKAELGFWLLPEYWQRGIMSEALQAMLPYLFGELHLHRLEAYAETENTASRKLLQQLGFSYEGTLRDCEFKKGRFISLAVYGLLTDVTQK